MEDRRANFVSVLAYFDGEKDHYFYDYEKGFLIDKEKGNNIRGWANILYIYGYPTYLNRSLAELNDQEWESYLIDIEKNDFIEEFKTFLT